MRQIVKGDCLMVSAPTAADRFIAEMDSQIRFIQRSQQGESHENELADRMSQQQERLDTTVEEAVKASRETQRATEEDSDALMSALEGIDMTSASSLQIKNLETTIGAFQKLRGELETQLVDAGKIHREQRMREAELQQSLTVLQGRLKADMPILSCGPFLQEAGGRLCSSIHSQGQSAQRAETKMPKNARIVIEKPDPLKL